MHWELGSLGLTWRERPAPDSCKQHQRGLPWGPGVKTSHFHCRRCRFHPWSGNYDPTWHSPQPKKKIHESELPPCAGHCNSVRHQQAAPSQTAWSLAHTVPQKGPQVSFHSEQSCLGLTCLRYHCPSHPAITPALR